MKLCYSTLTEKYGVVENVNYDGTISGLIKLLEKYRSDGYVFRGQENALWPIVSSAQRAYVEYLNSMPLRPHKTWWSYTEFLAKLLSFVKGEEWFIPRPSWREFPREKLFDHETWGWLQHYSYRTPFIDFSNDPFVALFMATYKIGLNPNLSKMFSVYALNGNEMPGTNEVMRLEKFIEDETSRLADIVAGDKLPESQNLGLSKENMFSFGDWGKATCITIHKDGTMKPWDSGLGKERIASQNGLFVYLNRHDISLEQYCAAQNKMNEGEDGVGCRLLPIKCFDVPTSLAPCILELCRRENYTEESLGLSNQRTDACLKSLYDRFCEVW